MQKFVHKNHNPVQLFLDEDGDTVTSFEQKKIVSFNIQNPEQVMNISDIGSHKYLTSEYWNIAWMNSVIKQMVSFFQDLTKEVNWDNCTGTGLSPKVSSK